MHKGSIAIKSQGAMPLKNAAFGRFLNVYSLCQIRLSVLRQEKARAGITRHSR
ncbi:Uncharacterised protein [Pseudomonas luteola]|uniref:Uncharacterized protein n=1 Tax=Pseudomonas luteola TaxID=47886 RepID=A0A2X2CR30_PSELU|nr:hypothetical protein SAMN05216295_11763 [Pseudomonas zeshuii]SPZ09503.1 Uncharacterised protein [Pseudomonas luteola]